MGSLATTNQYSLWLNAHFHTSLHPSPEDRTELELDIQSLCALLKNGTVCPGDRLPMTSFHVFR